MKIIHKICFISVLLYSNLIYLFGQNYCNIGYDHVWIMGDVDVDTTNNEYGGCEINFNTSPVSFALHPRSIANPFQNASMSSITGDLAFYSNGCSIFNNMDFKQCWSNPSKYSIWPTCSNRCALRSS